jgi:hypothetical protein
MPLDAALDTVRPPGSSDSSRAESPWEFWTRFWESIIGPVKGSGSQLERLRITPAECLFVDDDVRNVRGAIAIGMRAALIDRSRLERSRSADGTYYRYRQSHPLAHPF